MKSNKNKRARFFNPNPDTHPNLPDPDQQKRIEHLRQQIKRISGDQAVLGSVQDCPPDVLESFLEQVLDFETAPPTTALDLLAEEGIEVPAPDTLNGAQLHEQLWKVIHGLARLRTYLEQTDHLSDRELYTRLWEDLLPQETTDIRDELDSAYHLDLLGGCSEQDVLLRMRHYADEDERARWLESFPDYQMPPHEDPPYDRDRLLPRPNRPCDRAATGNNWPGVIGARRLVVPLFSSVSRFALHQSCRSLPCGYFLLRWGYFLFVEQKISNFGAPVSPRAQIFSSGAIFFHLRSRFSLRGGENLRRDAENLVGEEFLRLRMQKEASRTGFSTAPCRRDGCGADPRHGKARIGAETASGRSRSRQPLP